MVRDTFALVFELGRFLIGAGYLAAWEGVESRLARCSGRWAMRHPRGIPALVVQLSLNLALFLWRRLPFVETVAIPLVNTRIPAGCGCDEE